MAFFATVIALMLAGAIGLVVASDHAGTQGAIPWILGFVGLVFLLIVGGIFAVMLRDPSKLMLGQITGEEYAQIRRMTLGDSRSGEQVVVEQVGMGQPKSLPPATGPEALPSEEEDGE